MAKGLVIAAPASGSGKTVVTLGLLRALRNRGIDVAAAKAGPDYIDGRFHEEASGRPCVNLDVWAMQHSPLPAASRLSLPHKGGGKESSAPLFVGADSREAAGGGSAPSLVLIEGVMGLFDGPEGVAGSTADLAAALVLPVVLVIDASHQGQSVGAVVKGFATLRPDVTVAGVILNRVASARHLVLLEEGLRQTPEVPLLGMIMRDAALALPSRHLGLVQAAEHVDFEAFAQRAAQAIEQAIDIDRLLSLAEDFVLPPSPSLPPLGQRMAIARDEAFAFCYPHLLEGWRQAGVELSFFSPLADETPRPDADAIYLPGGYPELHAGRIAANARFLTGLKAPLVYGECGGFMVLGDYLIDANGARHRMTGLLPLGTSFAARRLHLGYRQLTHSALPWPASLRGHEFHYCSTDWQGEAEPLFAAADTAGRQLPPMGLRRGGVMGSFAHVIA